MQATQKLPATIYVTEDICNTIRFTDSGVEVEDFATLCDGPESVNGQANSTNEVAYVTGLIDRDGAFTFADELARRWNEAPALREALAALLAECEPCPGVLAMTTHATRERARAALKGGA